MKLTNEIAALILTHSGVIFNLFPVSELVQLNRICEEI
jgi:hypothetical protein